MVLKKGELKQRLKDTFKADNLLLTIIVSFFLTFIYNFLPDMNKFIVVIVAMFIGTIIRAVID